MRPCENGNYSDAEMYGQPFNRLNYSEGERLALLAEEMGEALQAIGKILRHGYESYHPDQIDGPNNRQSLTRELGDVYAAIQLMCDTKDVRYIEIIEAKDKKLAKLSKFLHHNPIGYRVG